MSTSTQAAPRCVFAPFAGHLIAADGQIDSMLLARIDRTAVTSRGQLVLIDRPTEWIDGFQSWYVLPLHDLKADQMRCAISLVETLYDLPTGTLCADSIGPCLQVAAKAVGATLCSLRDRFSGLSAAAM